MKKLFFLLLLLLPLLAFGEDVVTDDTVKALLRDMGDPGELKLSDDVIKDLVFVKGAKKQGTAFFTKLGDDDYLVMAPELLVDNANVVLTHAKKEKIKPGSAECSQDGRVLRFKLSEKPFGLLNKTVPEKGAQLNMISLDQQKKTLSSYHVKAAGRGEGRLDLEGMIPPKYTGYPVMDDEGKVFGLLYCRLVKNIGDPASSTNRHVMACRASAAGIEEAKWEPLSKSFFSEYARLAKKEEALYEAAFLAWQWMHVTVFGDVKTNGVVESEALISWVDSHNKLAAKVSAEVDKAKNKKTPAKEVTEAVKKDASEFKAAITKAVRGTDQAERPFNQKALADRAQTLSENEKAILKGIDYMTDHVSSSLKLKK